MEIKRKSIFDIIREAEDDQEQDQAAEQQTNDEAPSAEESDDAGKAQDDEFGSDDDFNIDTNVDDGDDSGDSDNSEDSNDTSGGDFGSGGDGTEEVVPTNTDIFSTLTAKEQQNKIMELKKLFSELYSSTDDILEKINNTATTEDNMESINRLSATLYSLRQYISDYIRNVFATKSFIENDVAFNRFLSILNGISSVVNDMAKISDKN